MVSYTLVRPDIQISGEQIILCERKVLSELQEKVVFTENPMYERYILTPIQYELTSNKPNQEISITFPYANRLSEIEAKYAAVVKYDGSSAWIPLSTSRDEKNKTLHVTTNEVGVYAICLNDYWYSTATQRIADEYPLWTWIKQSKESNGQRFFNWFAMELEKLDEEFKEIQNQRYIDLLDIHMLDWVWVYDLPNILVTDDLVFYDDKDELPIIQNLREFFYNKIDGGGIIDYKNRRFYTRKEYKKFNGLIRNIDRREFFESEAFPHHIWNGFDEMGLLVGVKRLHRETNKNYKERIKDVFRYPANSGDRGLTNAIARELNLIHRISWRNDNKDLYLKGKGIDPYTIRVDGRELAPNEYTINELGHITIMAQYSGRVREISFIKDIEKYELHNKSDEDLYQIMFNEDGQASETLRRWASYINSIAPVMWGRFNWDEGYWDVISKELSGLGYLPNIWDSSIENWKDYKFNPKRWEGSKVWQS